jgi:hypothetical protein
MSDAEAAADPVPSAVSDTCESSERIDRVGTLAVPGRWTNADARIFHTVCADPDTALHPAHGHVIADINYAVSRFVDRPRLLCRSVNVAVAPPVSAEESCSLCGILSNTLTATTLIDLGAPPTPVRDHEISHMHGLFHRRGRMMSVAQCVGGWSMRQFDADNNEWLPVGELHCTESQLNYIHDINTSHGALPRFASNRSGCVQTLSHLPKGEMGVAYRADDATSWTAIRHPFAWHNRIRVGLLGAQTATAIAFSAGIHACIAIDLLANVSTTLPEPANNRTYHPKPVSLSEQTMHVLNGRASADQSGVFCAPYIAIFDIRTQCWQQCKSESDRRPCIKFRATAFDADTILCYQRFMRGFRSPVSRASLYDTRANAFRSFPHELPLHLKQIAVI